MFKKILLAAGLLCLTGMLSACGGQTEQKVTEIRVAFNQNENHPQYLAMKDFGEKFEKATNGRYHMTIYPNGVLGEQGAMAEFIRTGALQMAIVPGSVPEGYDADFAIVARRIFMITLTIWSMQLWAEYLMSCFPLRISTNSASSRCTPLAKEMYTRKSLSIPPMI